MLHLHQGAKWSFEVDGRRVNEVLGKIPYRDFGCWRAPPPQSFNLAYRRPASTIRHVILRLVNRLHQHSLVSQRMTSCVCIEALPP